MRIAIAGALCPLLSGCVAALAIPLVAGGALMARDTIRVRAATQVPRSAAKAPALAPGAELSPGSP